MAFVLNCILASDAMPGLKALRGEHLRYIHVHRSQILFGGPARGDDGAPQEMIIVLLTDDRQAAEEFIRAEPYNASGRVFSEVKLRLWSQVLPDASPGALELAIRDDQGGR